MLRYLRPYIMPGLLINVFTVLTLSSCSELAQDAVEEPIAAGIDSPDIDLSEYLQSLHGLALAAPESASMRGRLGMAYDINGLREAATATYGQAESLDPSDFRWPYFSSQLIAQTGQYEQALEALQRALANDAQYPPAWLWQGSWLLEIGQLDEALIAFDRAIDLGAGPAADLGRARVLVGLGRYLKATEILEPLARTSDHPFVHRTLGEALRGLNRVDEARMAMLKGKGAEPFSWKDERREQRSTHIRGYASYELAKSLSASGKVDEAFKIFERLQIHHPEAHCGREQDFFFACNLMNSTSIAYDRAGFPERALATVQTGLTFNEKFTPFHLTITNLFRQRRELLSALKHVERALDLNPSRGYAHEQRGRILFGLERYADAKVALETALEFEPAKRTSKFYLGLVEIELLHWADAVEQFEYIVQVEPRFTPGYVFLAQSLGEQGRIEEARKAKRMAKIYGASSAQIRDIEIRLRELEATAE